MTRTIELAADGVDLLSLHAANPARYPYLLESRAEQKGDEGWNILFAFPGETLYADDGDFLQQLDCCWQQESYEPSVSTLPFRGGWFLFLDYELAHQVEPILSRGRVPPQTTSFATRIPAAILQQHNSGRLLLLDETEAQYLEQMQQDVATCSSLPEVSPFTVEGLVEEDDEQFLQSVERIKHYIVEGDLFQANLSRQWSVQCDAQLQPYQLYQRLRDTNPAPFAGLVVQDGRAIISSSPERLVSVRDQIAETRPIAGTHPRGENEAEDQALSERLLSHPKEQAEHIMLIDLERNDLGRVCQPGSVEVDELMVLESYAHVHHIVSNVKGKLREGITPGAVIRALFPGGTITGCPKVRCMEVINELETEARGAYTGSFGYLNRDGSMDLNILIRTLMMEGNQVTLRAGAGIVHDSIPQRELAETRAKAKGMLMALGIES